MLRELTSGSLCSGYGGLDLAVEAVYGARTVWLADNDPTASKVLAARFPGAPNLGDIKSVKWDTVQRVDILTAGYPCQPFSHAGRRAGEADDRHLWPHVLLAIHALRPAVVVLENVLGHLSLGFDRVLGALAAAGFDAEWCVLYAFEVGAPHRRGRVFIVATDPQRFDAERFRGPRDVAGTAGEVGGEAEHPQRRPPGDRLEGAPPPDAGCLGPEGLGAPEAGAPEGAGEADRAASDASDPSSPLRDLGAGHPGAAERPGPLRGDRADAAADTDGHGHEGQPQRDPDGDGGEGPEQSGDDADGRRMDHWGKYGPAIDQWEFLLGRPAPEPLNGRQVNARFVEWMMGLPDGWVADIVPNRPALKVLGNGVVPQQAVAALLELREPHACHSVPLPVASASRPRRGRRRGGNPDPAPFTDGATMKTPTIRRARGRLEDLVREVCDQIATGGLELPEGQPWTPHRLAAQIKERYPASGVEPSTGAIADTLKRWRQIGFAEVEDGPLSFVGYTDEGRTRGLAELKQQSRQRRTEARRAEKAATSEDE